MPSSSTDSVDYAAINDRIKAVLSGHSEIKLAILFGSAAEGRLRPDSDLDVAVAADSSLSSDHVMNLQSELSLVTGREVDLLDLVAVSGTILQEALTKGSLLFVKDHVLYGDLIIRMLLNQTDMMPYVRRMLEERRTRFVS